MKHIHTYIINTYTYIYIFRIKNRKFCRPRVYFKSWKFERVKTKAGPNRKLYLLKLESHLYKSFCTFIFIFTYTNLFLSIIFFPHHFLFISLNRIFNFHPFVHTIIVYLPTYLSISYIRQNNNMYVYVYIEIRLLLNLWS